MGIDQNALAELRALDPDGSSGILKQIIEVFMKDATEILQQMQTALSANDASAMTRHAHTLKSTSLSLGATRVSEIAREIEAAAKSNALSACPMLLMALNAEYLAAEQLLKQECATSQKAMPA